MTISNSTHGLLFDMLVAEINYERGGGSINEIETASELFFEDHDAAEEVGINGSVGAVSTAVELAATTILAANVIATRVIDNMAKIAAEPNMPGMICPDYAKLAREIA